MGRKPDPNRDKRLTQQARELKRLCKQAAITEFDIVAKCRKSQKTVQRWLAGTSVAGESDMQAIRDLHAEKRGK